MWNVNPLGEKSRRSKAEGSSSNSNNGRPKCLPSSKESEMDRNEYKLFIVEVWNNNDLSTGYGKFITFAENKEDAESGVIDWFEGMKSDLIGEVKEVTECLGRVLEITE